MNKELHLKNSPKSILIISMRYLGDVLLTTPLIRSFRQSYPNAKISVLVYSNTAGILEGNPDINEIITTPQRPTRSDYQALFKKIFRCYDLSVVCQTGDRRFIYALLSAPVRIAFVPKRKEKGWWKRFLVQGWTELESSKNHTVLELLKLSNLLNIPPSYSIVPPRPTSSQSSDNQPNLPKRYAVLHIHPQWHFKRWTIEGWIEIGNYLNSLSITPVLSGSPAKAEMDYINSVLKYLPNNSINIAGKVSLAELSEIITQSLLFIGPDTGITHLAAATGTPVLAIFGPTNPTTWGPWPISYNDDISPFKKTGSTPINNIFLIQKELDCIPCENEGCDKHRQSHSQCLATLDSKTIIKYIDLALNKYNL